MNVQNVLPEAASAKVPEQEGIADLPAARQMNFAICSRVTGSNGQKYFAVPTILHPLVGAPPVHEPLSASRSM